MESSNAADAPWFVFAGGGTGGHLFPALSVVEVLRSCCPQAEVSFFCTQKPLDAELLAAAGVASVPQRVHPIPSRPWNWPGWWFEWREAVARCRQAFERRRPAAVVGAGGYASGPPVWAALSLGIPTYLLNPDAVPGRANRYLARRKKLRGIFAQWPVTQSHFPPGVRVQVTGCPVRRAFRSGGAVDPAASRELFGLEADRHTLLITGASQGARTLNDAVVALVGSLDLSNWQILHLTGAADYERVMDAYRRAQSRLGMWRFHGKVLPYTEHMAEAVTCADLVVSRAGASTLAELIAAGKPSVLLPYPYHRDQHQRHNAMVLVQAGAAVLIDDACHAETNASRLGPVLAQLMHDPDRRERMARAARTLDRPDAAAAIARVLLSEVGVGVRTEVAPAEDTVVIPTVRLTA